MSKVVKLSQPGFDVHTAGDENLIYNSNWPLLKIYKKSTFFANNPSAPPNQIIVNHNLGYVPAFWYYGNYSINSSTTVAEEAHHNLSGDNGSIVMTDKSLILEAAAFPINNKYYYYIFALNLDKTFTAPIIKVGGQRQGNGGTKIFKIALPNKDIQSTHLEDYAIHSQARSPLVHAVVHGESLPDPTAPGDPLNPSVPGRSFEYIHNLGYVPLYLLYVDDNFGGLGSVQDGWVLLTGTIGGAPWQETNRVIVDEKRIKFLTITNSVKVKLVVLKDPFLIDTRNDVVI